MGHANQEFHPVLQDFLQQCVSQDKGSVRTIAKDSVFVPTIVGCLTEARGAKQTNQQDSSMHSDKAFGKTAGDRSRIDDLKLDRFMQESDSANVEITTIRYFRLLLCIVESAML